MVPLEHIDGLFAYAMVLTRNAFEAADLVQETYVRAIQAMGGLREDSNVRRGCIPSCETFGSTKYGNDVPGRS
jgi:hypothetical protein